VYVLLIIPAPKRGGNALSPKVALILAILLQLLLMGILRKSELTSFRLLSRPGTGAVARDRPRVIAHGAIISMAR
jgi:hypothetical protein